MRATRAGGWRGAAGLLVALLLLLVPSRAGAVVFGSDLTPPANVTFDCSVIPSQIFALPSNATTCTWFGVGSALDLSGTFNVPAGRGVLTAARVKVGPVTGPMQIVVLRSLRRPGSTASPICCKEVNRSAVFVPAPNAVTQIPLNMLVRNDRVLEPGLDYLNFDTIAISVLAPGVPIPAFDTGAADPLRSPLASIWFPAFQPNEEKAIPTGVGGYLVLLQADWLPTPEGAPTAPVVTPPGPVAGAIPGTPAAVRLVSTTLPVRGVDTLVTLGCSQATPCAGIVRLQSRAARVAGQAGQARPITYASARFRIAPRSSARVRTRLNAVGRRLVRRPGRAQAWVNVTVGGRVVSATRARIAG